MRGLKPLVIRPRSAAEHVVVLSAPTTASGGWPIASHMAVPFLV
jgi:hypothetical protein